VHTRARLAFDVTDLCSYRVRGVDGSRAEHLTVESYTVVICQFFSFSVLYFLVVGSMR